MAEMAGRVTTGWTEDVVVLVVQDVTVEGAVVSGERVEQKRRPVMEAASGGYWTEERWTEM